MDTLTIFKEYCKDKIQDLGTIVIDEDDGQKETSILMTGDIREFSYVYVIYSDEEDFKCVNNRGEIIIDTPMITSEIYAARMEFIEIDKDYYQYLLDYWDDIDMDYLIKEENNLTEDTKKKHNGKWVNKGKDGEHGEFKTKKAADEQRKAMFANGYKG